MAKTVIGIPVEQEMLNVINLQPGDSTTFLFYTVHFIDLQNPVGFEEDIDTLLKNTGTICTRGAAGGLTPAYIAKVQARSRYLVVALGNDDSRSVGAFVIARPDHNDPAGIYIEASCNLQSADLTRKHPRYDEEEARNRAEVARLTKEELIEEFNLRSPPAKHIKTLGVNEKTYRSIVVKKRMEALQLEPIVSRISLRTAQLVKLTIFNYANKTLGMRHAYNSASGVDAAKTHARNGMTLRSANCGQPDQLAELFSKIPLNDKGQYMERMVKEGKFKLDDAGAYPMKLCNYTFNVLFSDLLDHTIGSLMKLEEAGFNTEDILSYDMSY